jgi:hypothetical protein
VQANAFAGTALDLESALFLGFAWLLCSFFAIDVPHVDVAAALLLAAMTNDASKRPPSSLGATFPLKF